MAPPILGIFNLGGGRLILILILLTILAVGAFFILGLVYLILRFANRPLPPVTISSLPPEIAAQNSRSRDTEHLLLLSIFHFVIAGIELLGILFLFFHYFMMHTIFANPELWKNQRNPGPPPQVFLDAFVWFYFLAGFILATALVLNLLSGLFLRGRKYRIFSLVVAGLDCLQFPFGTALGVFTLIVLLRDSVRDVYSKSDP